MTLATDTTPPATRPRRRRSRLRLPPWLGALVVTAGLVAATGHFSPRFLAPANLMNIAEAQAATGILAVGMTLVIVCGGIDLSVGSLLALAGGVGILLLDALLGWHWPDGLAVVAAALAMLGLGLTAGLVNGLFVAKGRLPAFIVTLAALLAFRSGAQWIANGGQFYPTHDSPAFRAAGEGYPIPNTDVSVNHHPHHRVVPLTVPYEVVVWAAVALLGMVVLNRTRLGRYAVAVGTNARAARYSAVPVARVRIWVFALSGLLAGVAAFTEAARFNSVNSGNAGVYLELYAIAAAVIGGARMEGGGGSILGSVIGSLLLGVIFNVMVHAEWHGHAIPSQAQGVVTGGIIVVAALIQRGGPRE
jgi:ribose transport system permease protein